MKKNYGETRDATDNDTLLSKRQSPGLFSGRETLRELYDENRQKKKATKRRKNSSVTCSVNGKKNNTKNINNNT